MFDNILYGTWKFVDISNIFTIPKSLYFNLKKVILTNQTPIPFFVTYRFDFWFISSFLVNGTSILVDYLIPKNSL